MCLGTAVSWLCRGEAVPGQGLPMAFCWGETTGSQAEGEDLRFIFSWNSGGVTTNLSLWECTQSCLDWLDCEPGSWHSFCFIVCGCAFTLIKKQMLEPHLRYSSSSASWFSWSQAASIRWLCILGFFSLLAITTMKAFLGPREDWGKKKNLFKTSNYS